VKVSGFLLTALALLYLYLWRSGQLGKVTPPPSVPTAVTPKQKMGKAAP